MGLRFRIRHLLTPHKSLLHQLRHLLGYTPRHIAYYHVALTHRSIGEGSGENNERLEFLGDAILGALVAEYLFKKYPYQPEGFMTEMRSRIVRRESLNAVAQDMNLNHLLSYNKNDRSLSRSHIFGNALEALIGAIYLDIGYDGTRKFIVERIIKQYLNIDNIEATDTNYKNQLLNWASHANKTVRFENEGESIQAQRRIFSIGIYLDGDHVISATGYNKKEAGQNAAKKALEVLEEKM